MVLCELRGGDKTMVCGSLLGELIEGIARKRLEMRDATRLCVLYFYSSSV